MEKKCERCGARTSGSDAGPYDLLDYCANCSRDLCDKCMAEGCCGHTPAISGMNMSISIRWRPADDEGKRLRYGTSSEYAIIIDELGQTINEEHVSILRAMAKASQSEFYDELADVVENIGAIKIWDTY